MFVMTAKISKTKLIAGAIVVIAVIVAVILLVSGGNQPVADTTPAGATNDERVAFLASYGWSVNTEPKEVQKVRIPEDADNRVFARYNELQRSQGFDLTAFAGKDTMRYVYEILNYPNAAAPVYASILVYDGHVIGGDITSTAPEGKIHGFALSGVTPTEAASESISEPAEPAEPSESEAPSESVEPSAA